MINAVIIDDEEHPRKHLLGLLERHHPNVVVTGQADDVPSGLELLRNKAPQLLFLDIELKDRTGFDLLRATADPRPQVIFTTAHESYAVHAIRFSALDYLLKPIDPVELGEALNRVQKDTAQRPARWDMLMKNVDRVSSERSIALPVSDGLQCVHVNEILACESDSNYTLLHLRDSKPMVITRTLKQFEDMLPHPPFVRVHNSFLVNTKHIRKWVRGEGGEVVLSNGQRIPVSRRKKQELLDLLDTL